MTRALFPELYFKTDFVFKISYEGSSFDGRINLDNLAEELSGFAHCLNTILLSARREKAIDINPYDYEFVVEPFKKGSFKKVIKLVTKKIEKHPATTNTALTIALIFVGIGQIIVTAQSNKIQSTAKELSQTTIDKIKLELLTDSEFLKSYSKVVNPLNQSGDKVRLTKPDETEYEIDFSQKSDFVKLGEDDFEFVTEVQETLVGRVTRVDLTATKNALGFKVNDSGTTIPCSFLDSINSEERKELLDKWIEITGISGKVGEERRHVTIYSYKVIPPHGQGNLPFIEQ